MERVESVLTVVSLRRNLQLFFTVRNRLVYISTLQKQAPLATGTWHPRDMYTNSPKEDPRKILPLTKRSRLAAYTEHITISYSGATSVRTSFAQPLRRRHEGRIVSHHVEIQIWMFKMDAQL